MPSPTAHPTQSKMRTRKLIKTLKFVSFSIFERFEGVSPSKATLGELDEFGRVRKREELTLIEHDFRICTSEENETDDPFRVPQRTTSK